MKTDGPLMGFCFSTTKKPISRETLLLFPSPYGDFVFQHIAEQVHETEDGIEFPSPYGDFVFQLDSVEDGSAELMGFRPLTGILFFNSLRPLHDR